MLSASTALISHCHLYSITTPPPLLSSSSLVVRTTQQLLPPLLIFPSCSGACQVVVAFCSNRALLLPLLPSSSSVVRTTHLPLAPSMPSCCSHPQSIAGHTTVASYSSHPLLPRLPLLLLLCFPRDSSWFPLLDASSPFFLYSTRLPSFVSDRHHMPSTNRYSPATIAIANSLFHNRA
ncbi:hypothetical protein B296_00028724 [Ensete ventricosum]|uniref:Uncharacterized protein n=1 Tax=Ensete ventricosum TaxID=4639 RepID=A0A426ZAN8_ENSVE|nr:hypothetical protein B296_00028724 [Ensete ventricosum]